MNKLETRKSRISVHLEKGSLFLLQVLLCVYKDVLVWVSELSTPKTHFDTISEENASCLFEKRF